MAFDAIEELMAAGQPVDRLSAAQQEVLRGLTRDEVATLNSVQSRVAAVSGDDVEGHGLFFGVGIF